MGTAFLTWPFSQFAWRDALGYGRHHQISYSATIFSLSRPSPHHAIQNLLPFSPTWLWQLSSFLLKAVGGLQFPWAESVAAYWLTEGDFLFCGWRMVSSWVPGKPYWGFIPFLLPPHSLSVFVFQTSLVLSPECKTYYGDQIVTKIKNVLSKIFPL